MGHHIDVTECRSVFSSPMVKLSSSGRASVTWIVWRISMVGSPRGGIRRADNRQVGIRRADRRRVDRHRVDRRRVDRRRVDIRDNRNPAACPDRLRAACLDKLRAGR